MTKFSVKLAYSRGTSMIEVLVALSVVAFGMLGLAGLQARSISFNKDSFDRKVAAEMIDQLSERMRANFDGFAGNQYDFTLAAPPGGQPPALGACGDPLNCQPDELADRDWAMWTADLRRYLPVSAAILNTTGGGQQVRAEITLAWQEGQGVIPVVDPACALVGITDPTYRCFSWTVRP